MASITWTHPGIARVLDAIPPDTRTLLDVGCGRGIVGALCRIYRECERLVGVDGHAPSLELCRRHSFYDELLELDLTAASLPFGEGEFDVVSCVEVIEHLPRETGEALLSDLERIGKRVVVTTPNGFLDQAELDDNPYQRHLSAWTVRDFRRRGYSVYGVGGMRVFGGHRRYVSSALGPVTRYVPSLSELLLCVRTRGG